MLTTNRLSNTGQNLYFHLNHPIKWVRLVGLIVGFELILNRFILILDDFSGVTIELTCVRKAPPPPPPNTTSLGIQATHALEEAGSVRPSESILSLEAERSLAAAGNQGLTATGQEVDLSKVDIGSIVKVKGGLGEFRGGKQILLERIWTVKSTTEEAAAWAENLDFRRNVLAKPWIVKEDEMRAARREAEGLDRKSERKKRKKVKGSGSGYKAVKDFKRPTSTNDRSRKTSSNRKEENELRQARIAEQKRIDEQERKAKEKSERQRIELEDAQRKERREALQKMKDEQERKRKAEEEEERKLAEEKERLAIQRRRRNEAREQALRELGAGR